MKQQIFEISKGQKWSIDIMETDIDHIHILIDYEPVISIFQIVHRIKQLSTYRIWKKHEELLKQFYWKEKTFWSDDYFACSTGKASTETIMEYIKTQGQYASLPFGLLLTQVLYIPYTKVIGVLQYGG
jgi:putative transposase